ncbi:MAG: bifunctional enoyl-CoA hydratase/phosphate acetyltransferase [Kosmotoga sp.]|nr:MAG: bifunctional enoyl-CoA hydratase/phosphate acetyltransferase [Kosmotoga sp.]
MIKTLNDILNESKKFHSKVAVAVAEDRAVLKACKNAINENIAEFILFGNEKSLKTLTNELDMKEGFKIVNTESQETAIRKSVESVAFGDAQLLMKGKVRTGDLLKEFLDEKYNLRTNRTMNLVSVFQVPDFDRLLIVSDAGMVIQPTLKQKIDCISNCIDVAKSLKIVKPKIALLGAVETVNPKMSATMDAATISKMADRGQIKDAEIDGPFALDNAVSVVAAKHKGISSNVAGKADVLIMPDIEAGNIFYKGMVFLAGSVVASTISGGKKPIILTSRADTEESKLYSIALNVLLAEGYHV